MLIIKGSGEVNRRDVALWNVVIDQPVKPVFDGALRIAGFRGAVAEIRAAADREWLLQIVGEIKSRAAASNRPLGMTSPRASRAMIA